MNFYRAKILNFYILRQYTTALLLVFAGIFSMVYLLNFVEFAKDKAQYRLSFLAAPKIVLFETFSQIQIILPFVLIIASLLVLWRLSRSLELVIVRAVGGSFWQFISPMVTVALLLGMFQVMLINPAAYALETAAHRARVQEGIRSSSLQVKTSGLWMKDGYDNIQPVIHAKKILNSPGDGLSLEEMSIVVVDKYEAFISKLYANKAVLQDGFFRLSEVSVFEPGEVERHLPDMDFKTTLTLDKIQKNLNLSTKNFSFWELPEYIAFLDGAGFSSLGYRIHFYTLLAFPLMLVAFLLVCAALLLDPNQRSVNFLWRVVLAIISGFLVYFCNQIVMAMGTKAVIPVWLATFGTPLIAILVSSSWLLHVEDG